MVHGSKNALCCCKTLVRSELEQLCGPFVIFGHSIMVHDSKNALRRGKTLDRSELEQRRSPRIILGHTASVQVHDCKPALRRGIALVRSELEQRRSPRIILGYSASITVHACKPALRCGIALVRSELCSAFVTLGHTSSVRCRRSYDYEASRNVTQVARVWILVVRVVDSEKTRARGGVERGERGGVARLQAGPALVTLDVWNYHCPLACTQCKYLEFSHVVAVAFTLLSR